jgi:serine/threonine-protein kinase
MANHKPDLVMEWLHGQSFTRLLTRGHSAGETFPAWLAIRIVVEAARGLHAAHELKGPDGAELSIVHRDVSPSNIHVLFSGAVKVIDFGIAHAQGRLTEATAPGQVRGKVAYMSPEQIQGDAVDRRADVWSLGVVLWESLTGRRLFRADTEATTMLRVLSREVPAVRTFVADIAPAVELVVEEALRRDPQKRLGSALEMADRLEKHLYALGQPSGASQIAEWMKDRFEHDDTSGFMPADDISTSGLMSTPKIDLVDTLPPKHPSVSASEAPPKRSPVLVVVGVALAVLVGLAAGFLLWSRADAPAPTRVADQGSGGGTETPMVVPAMAETQDPPTDPASMAQPAPDLEPTMETAETMETPETMAAETVAAETMETMQTATMETMGRRSAAPGRVNIVAVPSAEVRFRGRRLGTTPLAGVSLPGGRQRLTFVWPDGTTKRVPVRVRAGGLVRVGPIRR